MRNFEQIEPAVQSGLSFLAAQQLPAGNFGEQSNPASQPWGSSENVPTVFGATIMLNCLAALDNQAAADISRKLASYLLQQRSTDGSYNYWPVASALRRSQPYPNDLDDTFCALIALYKHQPSLVDSSVLAQMTKLLLAAESTPGGPYYTWLVAADSPTTWRQLDVAVNANVAFFLQLINVRLPRLDQYLATALKRSQFESQYYPDAWAVWYYLARWCPNQHRDELRAAIEKALIRQSAVGAVRLNPLQTALCLTSLGQLGSHAWLLQALTRRLLASQQSDGSWPAAGFCLDPSINGQVVEHGSTALTTALALEALSLARNHLGAKPVTPTAASPKILRQNTIQIAVQNNVSHTFDQFGDELSQPVRPLLSRLCSGATGSEICLLAYQFARSLDLDSAFLNLNTFVELGTANLMGWLAYSAFDDLLDQDAPVGAGLLPAANIALRASRDKFKTVLASNPAFLAYIDHTFNAIDQANAWELAHCRAEQVGGHLIIGNLPNYGDRSNLSQRSFGHALAPLGVLILAGHDLASPAVRHVQAALEHYLVARQLQDDLHDWTEDLAKGRLTYVVSEVMRELGLSGRWQITELQTVMRRQFWHHSFNNISDVIEFHLGQARRQLAASQLLQDNVFDDWLLGPLHDQLQDGRQKQKQILGFLQCYRAARGPRLLTLP
jgi:hypothetical protein